MTEIFKEGNIMKAVVVLSGGLDSTILTYKLVKELGASEVCALSFNYGQKQSIELTKAALTCKKLGITHNVIDISFLGEIVKPVCANIAGTDIDMPTIQDVLGDPQPPTYVPYRNLILNSIAVSFAESNGCSEVYNGCQSVDEYGYWDTSKEFFTKLNAVTLQNRQNPVIINTPFISMTKADEIKIGLELGVPFEDSLSCYNPSETGESCGTCPTCAERINNFALAGVIDPAPYSVTIPWNNLIT